MKHEEATVQPAPLGHVERGVVPLSANALKFMRSLTTDYPDQGGWAECKTNPPGAAIQGLVDGGYCRLSPARSGPLGLLTGAVMVTLTDAGRSAVRHNVRLQAQLPATPSLARDSDPLPGTDT